MIKRLNSKDFLSYFKEQEFVPVILPVAFTNGLGQVRGLGREGIKSIAISPDPKELTFYSRFAYSYVIANPWESEGLFVDELLQIGEKLEGRGILFFSYPERYLSILWKYKKEIKKTFILPFDMETIFHLEDKENQIRTADEAGLSIPQTIFLKSGEGFESVQLDDIEFPIFVRPKEKVKEFYAKFDTQGFYATTLAELKKIVNLCEEFSLIIQDYIPGPDSNRYFLGSYMSKNHEPLGTITYKVMRPTRLYGSCAMCVSCETPGVLSAGLKFLTHAKYHGPSDMAFKFDTRDGKFKFIEINNRFWKAHSLATACGVNLPYLQYLDAIGQSPSGSLPKQENGKRWWLPWIDMWVYGRKILKGEMNPRDYLKTLSFNFVNGVGSWDDPLPELVNFFSFKWMK